MKFLAVASLCVLVLFGCGDSSVSPEPVFSKPVKVSIQGYSGNAMEPFLSRDAGTLFFNNLNSAPENTNLHWASQINDSTFQYKGEISGVNTPALEAVASMDVQGRFYFVSDANYSSTLSSVYTSQYANGAITNIGPVYGLSKGQVGWINSDAEVSADGQTLYVTDGRYDQTGGPYEADITIASRISGGYERFAGTNDPLKNINSVDLEYGACISANSLELYFTRVTAPITANSKTGIYRAGRTSVQSNFGFPSKIESITGFAEAPTISPDGKIIYYHKNENGKYVIYYVRKI